MNCSADITDDELRSIVAHMPTRVHYRPAGKHPPCGILKECTDLATDGRLLYFQYRQVLTTTDIRRVNCPKCALILRSDVAFICSRLGV